MTPCRVKLTAGSKEESACEIQVQLHAAVVLPMNTTAVDAQTTVVQFVACASLLAQGLTTYGPHKFKAIFKIRSEKLKASEHLTVFGASHVDPALASHHMAFVPLHTRLPQSLLFIHQSLSWFF